LMTMADFRTNLTQQVIEEVRNYFGEKVFNTVITRSVKISEAPSFGKPIVLYDPASKGARAYEDAAAEVILRFQLARRASEAQSDMKPAPTQVIAENVVTEAPQIVENH
ncbi:MAG: ParA family protein, partial [Candidatus Omnitrophica bacterium]|nr:ParA family protein [Candidatus Omnitrophota bacterium]